MAEGYSNNIKMNTRSLADSHSQSQYINNARNARFSGGASVREVNRCDSDHLAMSSRHWNHAHVHARPSAQVASRSSRGNTGGSSVPLPMLMSMPIPMPLPMPDDRNQAGGTSGIAPSENATAAVAESPGQQAVPVATGTATATTTATTTATATATATALTSNILYDDWVNAPEFVPSSQLAIATATGKVKSYAEVVNPTGDANANADKSELKLCPYAEMHGLCSYAEGECPYVHGDICELCGNAALHPYNPDKRKQHTQECISQHERNMELSFAVARSKEKSCGVCFEVIMEKATREQRFGILPNCNHCFCLSCIRKWRQAKQFDNKIIRACPECRVTSDFVCPSMYWVDTKEEKEKLIMDYKCALSRKNCKYFKQGRGKCPFGNKCFYLHALPDGTKTDVGPPPRQPRRHNHEGEIDVLQQIILWDFLDDRENRWLYSIADDLEDLVAFFSDSEDSDWSEYDFFFD